MESQWCNKHVCSCPYLLPTDDDEKGSPLSVSNSKVDDDFSLRASTCCSPTTTRETPTLGNAFDLILVQSSTSQKLACSDALYWFDVNLGSLKTQVVLEVQGSEDIVWFPIEDKRIQCDENNTRMDREESYSQCALTSLSRILNPGRNPARYLLLIDNIVVAMAPMFIFFWSSNDRLVIVDIDGTITRSNIRGVVDTVLTESYQYAHDGVCEFFSALPTRVVFLSTRPIRLANSTRKFLSEVQQNNKDCLPHGAWIGFMGHLASVMIMELITFSVSDFKEAAIQQQILKPFADVGASKKDVLVAAFGNTVMDMEAYHRVGLGLDRLFLIDKESAIYCLDNDGCKTVKCHDDYLDARGSLYEGYKDRALLERILQAIIAR